MGRAVEYLAVESPIHRLNPLTKLAGVISFFTLGLVFSNPLILLGIMLAVFLFFFLAGAGRILRNYLKPLLGVGIFILLIKAFFSLEGLELFGYIRKDFPFLVWFGA